MWSLNYPVTIEIDCIVYGNQFRCAFLKFHFMRLEIYLIWSMMVTSAFLSKMPKNSLQFNAIIGISLLGKSWHSFFIVSSLRRTEQSAFVAQKLRRNEEIEWTKEWTGKWNWQIVRKFDAIKFAYHQSLVQNDWDSLNLWFQLVCSFLKFRRIFVFSSILFA